MVTKYEREQQYTEERIKRQNNIEEISQQLKEAKSIYEVCNNSNDRNVVTKEINNLEEMLYNEQRALATIGVNEINYTEIVNNMDF